VEDDDEDVWNRLDRACLHPLVVFIAVEEVLGQVG
jgi:hypothetical protein